MLVTGVSASTQHRCGLADPLARWAPVALGPADVRLSVSEGGRALASPGPPGARRVGGSASLRRELTAPRISMRGQTFVRFLSFQNVSSVLTDLRRQGPAARVTCQGNQDSPLT